MGEELGMNSARKGKDTSYINNHEPPQRCFCTTFCFSTDPTLFKDKQISEGNALLYSRWLDKDTLANM